MMPARNQKKMIGANSANLLSSVKLQQSPRFLSSRPKPSVCPQSVLRGRRAAEGALKRAGHKGFAQSALLKVKKRKFQNAAFRVWASIVARRKLDRKLSRQSTFTSASSSDNEADDEDDEQFYVIPRRLLRKLSLLSISNTPDTSSGNGNSGGNSHLRKRMSITMLQGDNLIKSDSSSSITRADDKYTAECEVAPPCGAGRKRRCPSLASVVSLMMFRELHNKKVQENTSSCKTREHKVDSSQTSTEIVDDLLPKRFSAHLSNEGRVATYRCYQDQVVARLTRGLPTSTHTSPSISRTLLNRPRKAPRISQHSPGTSSRRSQTTTVTVHDLRDAISLYDDFQGKSTCQEDGPVAGRTRNRKLPDPTANALKRSSPVPNQRSGRTSSHVMFKH